jgi:hypothetical protein
MLTQLLRCGFVCLLLFCTHLRSALTSLSYALLPALWDVIDQCDRNSAQEYANGTTANIENTYALFNPPFNESIVGLLQVARPLHACGPIDPALDGARIALIKRGPISDPCFFAEKV